MSTCAYPCHSQAQIGSHKAEQTDHVDHQQRHKEVHPNRPGVVVESNLDPAVGTVVNIGVDEPKAVYLLPVCDQEEGSSGPNEDVVVHDSIQIVSNIKDNLSSVNGLRVKKESTMCTFCCRKRRG